MLGSDASWDARFKEWYDRLDAFIKEAEADKGAGDLNAWADKVNSEQIAPLRAFFAEKFGASLPVKIDDLSMKKQGLFGKVPNKADLVGKLKAVRYAMYEFQKKSFLESAGDLS